MQEGTEGFQRAIGKPFGRLRRGEIPCEVLYKHCKRQYNKQDIKNR